MEESKPNDSLSAFDKFFLLMLIVMVSIGWVFVLFKPVPNPDIFYYFLIYGPPGWIISAWLLGVWFLIISSLVCKHSVNKTPTTLYRVDDEYDLYLKEAYKEIDEFLKYENDYNSKRTL